ncbi:MAG: hypothetical protein OEQ39_00230 [Gammaproteobacteria bacterium]|nr:hypothetical protein [Gammaproteobacteria bacterium]
MSNKLKIANLHEAADLAAKGYDIECYLILPPADVPYLRRHKSPSKVHKADTTLGFSPEGTPPRKGKISHVWPLVQKQFFADPTKTATYGAIAKFCENAPYGTKNNVSQFIHVYHVLRVVEEKADA